MRRLLVLPVLAGVLLLTGCGQDQSGEVVDDPTHSHPSDTPTSDDGEENDKEPEGEVDFELVEMITETAAGGETVTEAVALGDETAVDQFAAQFETERMRSRLLAAFDKLDVPDGKALYGAVVAIGCDVPPGVIVTNTDTGLHIQGQKVPSPMQECFAPMTTVALVLVDESVVG